MLYRNESFAGFQKLVNADSLMTVIVKLLNEPTTNQAKMYLGL